MTVACIVYFAVTVIFFAAPACAQDEWMVHLDTGHISPAQWAAKTGMQYAGSVGFLPGFFKFRSAATMTRDAHERARAVPGTLWAEPQVKRPRMFPRAAASTTTTVTPSIPDPLYQQQWHLHDHPWSVQAPNHATHVQADREGGEGANVTIAIVDDGLEYAHPDLRPNYRAAHSWNYNKGPHGASDCAPVGPESGHGTCAAGVAAAASLNGHCGRGVAPKAGIAGVRLIAEAVTDATEAEGLSHHAMSGVDIYSCSWGPYDDGATLSAPDYMVRYAMAYNAGQLKGRMGRGSIYVWAAGNGRANGDSCAFDGYATSPFAIAIGAVDYNGDQAWYSESCAALMAVAPSNGASGHGITTVDRLGSAGYDAGECTDSFGGTSSAAPLAAGIVALMLEARPELTWRDVKHVIAMSATPLHLNDPDAEWHTNARGYAHSPRFGFGLLVIPRLIAMARAHVLVPPLFKTSQSGMRPVRDAVIPHTFVYNVSAAQTQGITFIEHVMLTITLTHDKRGHVQITLESPEGTVSEMAPVRPQDDSFFWPSDGFRFMSVRHWGESKVAGPWTIRVTDDFPDTRGRFVWNGFALDITGY